jgi:hypothetical protein
MLEVKLTNIAVPCTKINEFCDLLIGIYEKI